MISNSSEQLSTISIDRIIEMAWEDRTTFESIQFQFGLKEQEVIDLMRREMKLKSFQMWRKRVQGRKTKHEKLRTFEKGDLNAPDKEASLITLYPKDNKNYKS